MFWGLYIRFETTFPTFFIFCQMLESIPSDWRASIHTSTCSFDQESMLSDLTFVIWVPSLRCKAAHRIHRKTPSYTVLVFILCLKCAIQLGEEAYTPAGPSCHTCQHSSNRAQEGHVLPGFLAWQSAHTLFPGTDLIRSCKVRSLRACCLLLNAPDMVED